MSGNTWRAETRGQQWSTWLWCNVIQLQVMTTHKIVRDDTQWYMMLHDDTQWYMMIQRWCMVILTWYRDWWLLKWHMVRHEEKHDTSCGRWGTVEHDIDLYHENDQNEQWLSDLGNNLTLVIKLYQLVPVCNLMQTNTWCVQMFTFITKRYICIPFFKKN